MPTSSDDFARWLRLFTVLAVIALLATLTGVAVRLGMFIPHTLLLFSLATLAAYALDPVVEWIRSTPLKRLRWIESRGVRVALVYLMVLVLMGLAAWAMEGRLVDQISAIRHDYPSYYAKAMELASRADRFLTSHGIRFSLTQTIRNPPPDVKALGTRLGYGVLPFLSHLASLTGDSLVVFIIAVYLSLFAPDMRNRFNALLPADVRSRVDAWEKDVNYILGRFVRGQLIIALVMGVAAAIGCAALGLQSWLIIAIFVAVTSVIPVFGPYVSGIPPVLAALVGPTYLHNPLLAAGLILIYFFVINEIGSNVLYPKLVGDALGLHTVLVLFVLFAGLELAGIVGALFSAPITAVGFATIVHLYRAWKNQPDAPAAAADEPGAAASAASPKA